MHRLGAYEPHPPCLLNSRLSWPALLATAAPAADLAAAGELLSLESLISLLTLTSLEVVLGIDNVIFIAILAGRLPRAEQPRARQLGIGDGGDHPRRAAAQHHLGDAADAPLVSTGGLSLSGKQLILFVGGLFLIGKSTFEIHDKLEGEEHGAVGRRPGGARRRWSSRSC